MKIDSYANISILAIANAFAFAVTPLLIFTASLIGVQLAPNESLATAPVTSCIIGIALGIWPAARVTKLFGRKSSFFLFLWLGVAACFLAALGIARQSFYIFSSACLLFGISSASTQQFRYAAIECLGKERAATAASIILSGGIVAAFIGPELAVIGKDFTTVEYQGSFWLSAACLVIASILVLIFRTAPIESDERPLTPNPLSKMLNPGFCLAICSGSVSYFVMTLVMTATPISMHHYFMHSLTDTKFVIQSHIAAMFLPSLVSPFFFRILGTLNMMKVGLSIYALLICLGYFFTSVFGFWLQLVLLGIGWNFLFVAGTSMLSNSYQPQDRLKAQSINDTLMFSLQAIASISAGMIMAQVSWAGLVSIGLAPVIVMMIAMTWYYLAKSSEQRSFKQT